MMSPFRARRDRPGQGGRIGQHPDRDVDRLVVSETLVDDERTPGPVADEMAGDRAEQVASGPDRGVAVDEGGRLGGRPCSALRLDVGRPGGLVAVDREEVLGVAPIPAIQLGERPTRSFLEVGNGRPRRRIRRRVEAEPVALTGGEQVLEIRKMPVHRQSGHASFLGDGRDRRVRRPDGRVQTDRGLRDALARLVDELGPAAHLVRARFDRTHLLTQC